MTSNIRSISREHRNTAKGLGYGFLIGAALGALISQTGDEDSYDCSDSEGICFTRPAAAVLGIIVVGPPAGLIGLISGSLTKTTERYEFK
ncbi:hypothetical protein GWN42_04590 [candidate division KSB1 bacterium]|nr:hypothetical protein [candidate division KSB1 bacterium]NIR68996.1 hypothetical protein [candidate division KSB1 bacterium]NIS22618.1 hypothetical protein [candidate division KSB1 bacterium]NIU23133.1 hypothetical protein [candidate division KSB1 bacterium]NIU89945.1 hypothetical protein [candidate division KSB1 bacterium]